LHRYAHLSPGKYSVLRELDFVRRASRVEPQLRYLYLGFYIPGNDKMMYKVMGCLS
jgi:arginyl-tRNA--protein-N-Asp/Glu arginylyltransferase